jgi:cell division septal protein FtsQ
VRRRTFHHKVVLRQSRARYQRRRFGHLFFVLTKQAVFGGLVLWGAVAAHGFWNTSPWFHVTDVRVEGLAPNGFHKRVGVVAGDHLFRFSAVTTQNRLLREFPEIAPVDIRRGFNRAVYFSVQKRRAVAKVFRGGAWQGVDGEGHLFPLDSSEALVTLGEGVPVSFLQDLLSLKEPWVRRLQELKMDSVGSVVLVLHDCPWVAWGPPLLNKRKAIRLGRVLQDPALAAGADTIKFVENHRLVVKPKRIYAQTEHNR